MSKIGTRDWTVKNSRWHRKRITLLAAPADVRAARAGAVHPREWRCGLHCGQFFRFAHHREVENTACHAKDGQAHEFILCPAHRDFPICVTHSPSYSDAGE